MNLKQLLCFLFFVPTVVLGQYPLDSLLNELDNAIENHEIYTQKKEQRIDSLKQKLLSVEKNSIAEYELNAELFREYRPYILDSAILYINKKIDIATARNDTERLYESRLQLAYLMSSTGMYLESVDVLSTLNREQLPANLLVEFYNTYRHAFSELAYYTQDARKSQEYWKISDRYTDSLKNLLTPNDELYYAIIENELRNAGNYEEALKINKTQLEKSSLGTRSFAIACYNRTLTFRETGNKMGEKYYLALSALSDIMSSTKDHASLWMLAKILYDENDIERAHNYIRFSWSETEFYNARLRSLQSAEILSLIDRTYQATVEKKNTQLQNYIFVISGLMILLVVALVFIYRQMKRLAAIRKNLQEANANLKNLNNQLQVVNTELDESNHIKEEYIGHFIKLCSTYINKMDGFRRMVNKKLTAGKKAELLGITRSREMMDNEIEELYRSFDKAFLQIFPHFVEKVNQLFNEDEKVELKPGELLNVELRILALIRLGINNSSQIADFLRYSVNTIYNYRAKIKNKTIYRDEFEDLLMNIR